MRIQVEVHVEVSFFSHVVDVEASDVREEVLIGEGVNG
jgi:hypothetical protein